MFVKRIFLVVSMLMALGVTNVYAGSVNLTDKLGNTGSIAETTITQEPAIENTTHAVFNSELKEPSADFIQQFEDMSSNVQMNASAMNGLSKVTSVIMNFSRLVIMLTVLAFSLSVALDLAYLAIPFARKFLANGHVGNANTGLQNNGSAGFGGGFAGGFGGGFGGGGMSQTPNNDVGSMGNRLQLVSSSALNAVAAEGNVDSNGTPINRFKFWLNDRMVTLIVLGVMFALIATGMLTKIMLTLGNVVNNLLSQVF